MNIEHYLTIKRKWPKNDITEQIKAFKQFPEIFQEDYTLRVTGIYNPRTVTEAFEKLKTIHWIVGWEDGHIHAVLKLPKGVNVKDYRELLKTAFNIPTPSMYSLSKIRTTPLKAIAYCIKDEHYSAYPSKMLNINPLQLKCAQEYAYCKGRKSFKLKHDELLQALALRDITKRKYFDSFVNLKLDHNQNIYWNHIGAHCTMIFMKHDPDYKNGLLQTKFEDLGLLTYAERQELWKEKQNDFYSN